MLSAEALNFLNAHRLCVFGYAREDKPPSLSPVYYVMDGEDLLISTMASRAKTGAVRRNAQVSLCVLHEEPPFPFLTVFGRAQVEETGVVESIMRIRGAIRGVPVPESERPAIEEQARREERVILRVTPESVYFTPPRPQPPR
ncbi:MAG: pyridoxamine 5'-phosphate oxidase family protein [Chloroflexi bacterium]|nr:pyridoxamine 5'-phosphate oxidase family protein [Chloroflexota bacterium]